MHVKKPFFVLINPLLIVSCAEEKILIFFKNLKKTVTLFENLDFIL